MGGSGPVELGGPHERRMLSALLLDAGRVVPLSRLVDALWDERPPAAARKVVRNNVSRLRQRLTDSGRRAPISTDPAGYVIQVGEGCLAANVFRQRLLRAPQLSGQGRLAEAVQQLRAALSLWDGPALGGVSGRVVETAAAGLNEQRLAALEECLSHELALGRSHELIAELSMLVADHPLRER